VEYLVTGLGEEVTDAPGEAAPVTPILEPGTPPIAPAPGSAPAPVVVVTPPTTDRDHDADEGAQLRYHKLEDLMGNVGAPALAGADIEQLHAISAEEPTSYTKAQLQECWRQTMKEEMKSILNNRIFPEVTMQ
jgi:hypothetical protein